MINNAVLVGRLTKDIEIRKTQSDKSVASFSLAINDRFNKDHTDFINCVAWNQSADYLDRYASKGDVIGLTGRITTRTYDGKNGKVYVTEVVADQVKIIESKRNEEEACTKNVPTYSEERREEEPSGLNLDICPDDLLFY